MNSMTLTRRALLASAAASAAMPLRAAVTPQSIIDAVPGGDRMRALVILMNGTSVVEERFSGSGLNQPTNVKSVSKSIVALLTGIAIDKGVVPGVSARLGDVAPRLIPQSADPRVADITLEDLVTLRAGLERTSGPNYGSWVSSPNWVADALSRNMIAEPGGRMLYSTGSTHILGAALAEAAGESLLTLARRWLGQPLGIEVPAWTRDPQGYYLGGNEMALSPRALARIGEMMREGGRWNGEQVVSADWLVASLEPRTRSPWSGLGYGYGWFLGRAGGIDYALARGYGGQVLAIAPDAGITVVITSDPTRPARSGGYFGELQRFIERDVIGALVG